MVKRANLVVIFSLILMVWLSASIQAQVNRSTNITPESSSTTSKTSKRYNFFLSWEGKRLGVITESIGKKKDASSNGVVVKDVIKNTSADRAGIKPSDFIKEIDGLPVKSAVKLRKKILSLDYGTEHTIKLTRNNSDQTIKFTLVESTDDEAYYNYYGEKAAQALTDFQNKLKKTVAGNKPVRTPTIGFANEANHNRLGVNIQELTDQLSLYFGVNGGGLLVSNVVAESSAEKAGFKAGDCIIAVNGISISNTSTFNKMLHQNTSSEITFTLIRDHQQLELMATVEPRK